MPRMRFWWLWKPTCASWQIWSMRAWITRGVDDVDASGSRVDDLVPIGRLWSTRPAVTMAGKRVQLSCALHAVRLASRSRARGA